jgi:beta-glucosidase
MPSPKFPLIGFLSLVASLAVASAASAQPTSPEPAGAPAYKNPAVPVDQRVADLLARMTLEEKVEQLRGVWQLDRQIQTDGVFDPAKARAFFPHGIGEIGPNESSPAWNLTLRDSLQKYFLEQTRLGIPAIVHDEACHGFKANGATSYPVPIGLAGSWDPALIERIFAEVAGEMRYRGVQQALAPVVDICRDPRWGRTDETMGEDPYLNGQLGAAMVRGLQGSSTGTVAPGHVAATLKHFAGHGAPQAGINRAPNDLSQREMVDAHLVPFRLAIAGAHPAAIMPAYTEVNAIPAHNNTWLLQEVLRGEWQYDGLIVSDYDGVEFLARVHGVAADNDEAALKAITAGVEVNLPGGQAYQNLAQLVRQGRLPEKIVDQAVRRVLRLKFALGLFENPYGDAPKATELPKLESTRALALEAARKSIVLLKNRDGLLPLDPARYPTIAVVGPNAASARLGSYSGEPLYKVSILEGVRKKVGERARVVYAEGCKIITNLPESSFEAWHDGIQAQFPSEEANRASIAAAVAEARKADVIILVLGENEVLGREAWDAKHVGDRSSIELIGAQNELAQAMFGLGKPVVVYLMGGRPLAVPRIAEQAGALLEGWYMGQETGNAAADVLFGDVNPSGKLTITVPRSTGQIPIYYNHKPGAGLYNYVDETNAPLFPFGFGLSYTTFAYSTPVLSAPAMRRDGHVTVSVTVTNSGQRAGDEIVQFYIHQKVGSVTRPIMELRGFQRIALAPGENRTVAFDVEADTLAAHDIRMIRTVEAADFELMVGPSSAELQKVVLRVTE